MKAFTSALSLALSLLLAASPAWAHWSRGAMDWESVPRVLYGPGEEGAVRAKLESGEPYLTLYRRVLDVAAWSCDLEDHSVGAEQRKANVAKAAAFVYAMDRRVVQTGRGFEAAPFETPAEREVYGALAEEMLLHMYTLSRFNGGLTSSIKDIHTAQELSLYATAYDILKGAEYSFADEARVVTNLVDLAADFYKDYVHDMLGLAGSLNENHQSKSAAALGVAAIALNSYDGYLPEEDPQGYRKPENWIDFAVRRTDFIVLDALVSREGSYSEGAVYYAYTAINHLPFFRAMHRYVGARGWAVDGFEHGDLLLRPENLLVQDWLVRIRQPDGTFPPFDDCTPRGQYYFGMLTDLPHGGLYRWAWDRQPSYACASGSIRQEPDTIVIFDGSVAPVAPEDLGWSPNQFLYDGGQAIFRSSWEPDAIYMIVMAEHGKAAGWALRRDGEMIDGAAGHDHNDPCAIHMVAYGQPLLLDAGYLGWENHSKVNNARNHNLILVDGEGPQKTRLKVPEVIVDENGNIIIKEGEEGGHIPGADGEAYLNDWFEAEGLVYARVDTRYFREEEETRFVPTELARHVLFVHGRYFIVYDEVHPEDGEPHEITVLWHGNGGGGSGGSFEADNDGGRWRFGGAEVTVLASSAEAAIAWEEGEEIHDAGGWDERSHTVLEGTVSAPEVSFVSLIIPKPEGGDGPVAERPGGSDWWRIRSPDARADTYQGFAAAAAVGKLAACGCTARARAFFCEVEDGRLARFLVIGGRKVSEGGRGIVYSSDAPLRLLSEIVREEINITISGSVHLPPGGEATAWFAYGEEGGPLGHSGVCSAVSKNNGIEVTFRRAGDFSVSFGEGPAPVESPFFPLAVADASAGKVYIGEEVVIDAGRSCPSIDGLAHSFALVERPPFSQAALTDNGDGTASVVPDATGHYFVTLSVDDGERSDSATVRFFAEPAPDVDGDADIEAEAEADADIEAGGDADADGERERAGDGEEDAAVDGDVELADGDEGGGPSPEAEPGSGPPPEDGGSSDQSPATADDGAADADRGEDDALGYESDDGGGGCRSTGGGPAWWLVGLCVLVVGAYFSRRNETGRFPEEREARLEGHGCLITH